MKKLKDAVLGTLIIIGGIAYALKDIIIYIIYGIFIAIILYLAYYVFFCIVSYEKKYSVFKNTFNKLKNLLLSIYSQWYFESKDFFTIKEYIFQAINNTIDSEIVASQFLYIEEDNEAITNSQKKINDFLIQKQEVFLIRLEKEKYLNDIDHKIPKIIKVYYYKALETKLGFSKTTLGDLIVAYSQWYFESKDFFTLKDRIVSYIQDCNELNTHINDLERTNLNVAQRDYGQVISVDTSLYDYKRPYFLSNKEENTFYTANLNLYKNAENQPFKYFCKYFNIAKDEITLADFEDKLNAFCAIQEGKFLLEAEKTRILETMGNDIPSIIKTYAREKLEHQLGFEEVGFHQLSYPTFIFKYVSAGGLSSLEFEILFDEEGLERFIIYLSNEIKYLQSAKYQRALMSKNLREYIKKRDNYTCRYCKNSTHIEPNLLLEIDHIIPLSKGGLSVEENLQTLCWRCNRSKGTRIIDKLY